MEHAKPFDINNLLKRALSLVLCLAMCMGMIVYVAEDVEGAYISTLAYSLSRFSNLTTNCNYSAFNNSVRRLTPTNTNSGFGLAARPSSANLAVASYPIAFIVYKAYCPGVTYGTGGLSIQFSTGNGTSYLNSTKVTGYTDNALDVTRVSTDSGVVNGAVLDNSIHFAYFDVKSAGYTSGNFNGIKINIPNELYYSGGYFDLYAVGYASDLAAATAQASTLVSNWRSALNSYTGSEANYAGNYNYKLHLKFDLNGGSSFTPSFQKVQSFANSNPTGYVKGEAYSTYSLYWNGEPSRSGYTFDYWDVSSTTNCDFHLASRNTTYDGITVNGAGTFGYGSDIKTSAGEVTATLKARWKGTAKFDANGGSASSSSKSVVVGDKLGDLPTASRTGYTFNGWYTANSGGSKVTKDTVFSANTTYYAQWTIKSYTATFKDYNGTVLKTQSVNHGSSPTAPSNPTRASTAQYSYAFKAWSPAVGAMTADQIYTATYTQTTRSYTIKFVNWDGTVLSEKSVAYGTVPTAPSNPTRAADAQYTYAFKGWDNAVSAVTGAKTYTATYTPTTRSYTIKFVNWDGTVLSEKSVAYGTVPTAPSNPTRAADAQYTYAFKGWDSAVSAVTGAKTYTATYTPTTRSYTVTWNGNGGTPSQATSTVAYGNQIGTLPTASRTGYTFNGWYTATSGGTKIATTQTVTGNVTYYAQWTANTYTVTYNVDGGDAINSLSYTIESSETLPIPTKAGHTFAGWKVTSDGGNWSETSYAAGTSVNGKYGNVTLTAQWNINTYTITWQNEDGSTIDTTIVEYSQVPTHADPEKADTAEWDYTFAGWTPEVVPATANATYKATFTETKRSYTVTWVNWDGSVIDTQLVEYGTVPSTNVVPTKAEDDTYTYTFAGWGPAVVAVTGDTTYKATYTAIEKGYTITWVDEDGTVLETDKNVKEGTTPTYDGATPTKAATAEFTYTFTGWDPAIAAVTKDATYTAVFDKTVNKYTITWVIDGVETTEELEYGATPSHANPTKAADAQYTYTFTGWDPEITTVTGNATYTAQFDNTVNKYTITWVDGDGITLKSEELDYGVTPKYDGEIPTKAADEFYTYTFDKWSPDVTNVTGDATYTAQFTATEKTVTITYVAAGVANGGTVFPGSETVSKVKWNENLESIQGATATAKEGFAFKGWYATSDCTGEPVSTVPTFKPNFSEQITYYAKFAIGVSTMKIEKPENVEDQDFIFTVIGDSTDENTSDIKVTVVVHDDDVTIDGVPIGNYTVTEWSNWSWRQQTVTVSNNGEVTVTAETTVEVSVGDKDPKWLSGDSWKQYPEQASHVKDDDETEN